MEYEDLILLVMSILAILVSISVSLLTILKKLEPRSSTFSQAGCAISFYVLIILDCCIICLCIHTFNITYNHYSYDMSTTIRDTIAVLKNSETALDTAAKFELSADDKTISAFDLFVYELEGTSQIDTISQNGGDFNLIISQSMEQLNGIQDFVFRIAKSFVKDCGKELEWKYLNIVEQLLNLNMKSGQFFLLLKTSKSNFGQIKKLLLSEVERQKKTVVENSKVFYLLTTMKKMLKDFKDDIVRSDTTKQGFLDEIYRLYPDKEKYIKVLIRFAALLFSVTGLLSLLGFCRFFDDHSPFAMRMAILFSSIFAIVVNLIIICIVVDLIGLAKCPLEGESFGIKNFTIDHENQIGCISSEDTFFSFLKNDNLASSDNIGDVFKIVDYKKKVINVVQMCLKPIKYPNGMIEVFENLRNTSRKLAELETSNCFNSQDKSEASRYQISFRKILKVEQDLRNDIVDYNENLANVELLVNLSANVSYEIVLNSLEKSMKKYTGSITKFDFKCDRLVSIFADVGSRICQEVDFPTNQFCSHFVLIILTSLGSVIFQLLAYRRLQVEMIEFGSEYLCNKS